MNFGRRWRVPKLVLAIPGSAEFLARTPGVWQKRAAIIKAHHPSTPLLPVPRRIYPRLTPLRFAFVVVLLPRALARSFARSLARSRFAGWRRIPSSVYRSRSESERGDRRWCAQARGSNGKKSAGLTTGDGRRIDRANIGDRERRSLRV